MKKTFKFIVIILVFAIFLSVLTAYNVSAQEGDYAVSNGTEWKPYNTSDNLVEVFEINPSGNQVIDSNKIEHADSPQELMAARGSFSTLYDLFKTRGYWFNYGGGGRGTWSGGTFTLTDHGMFGGVSVFVFDSNGNYLNTYKVSCVGSYS